MASISPPTLAPPQSRESWITPQEQLEFLASPMVRQRLDEDETRELLESLPEGIIDRIPASVIRSSLKSIKGETGHFPTLFDMVIEQLVEPRPLPSNQTNWYTALERIGALPDKIPALPRNIHEILGSPCPIHSTDKTPLTVGQTHSLYLLPPGSLNELEQRVSSYGQKFFQGENPLKFGYFWRVALEEHANVQFSEPQWVLISNDVLPGSRNQNVAKQAQMVETLSKKSLTNYQVPTLREAIGAVFLHKVATGESLYPEGNEQNGTRDTFTRVKETTQNTRLIVGGFAPSGLRVHYDFMYESERVGLHVHYGLHPRR